jgi:hypothetical protein
MANARSPRPRRSGHKGKERKRHGWDTGSLFGCKVMGPSHGLGPVSLLVILALVGPSETGARGQHSRPAFVPALQSGVRGLRSGFSSDRTSVCIRAPASIVKVPCYKLWAGTGAARSVCLAKKPQDSEDGYSEGADSVDDVQLQKVTAEDGFVDMDETESIAEDFTETTIEVSGEPLALRDPNEVTPDDDDDDESGELEGDSAGVRMDSDPEAGYFEETGDAFLKEWGRLSPADFTREVENLYPKDDDDMQADLLRARAEIARDELKNDEQRDAFDVDGEVEKLIAYQRQAKLNSASKAAAAALRKTTGIPGEVVQGGPEFPMLADYERAHDLHEKLAKRPVVDLDKLAVAFPVVMELERFKGYVSSENVTKRMKAGKMNEQNGLVAQGMDEVVLDAMGAAVKLARKERPGLTAPGGALYESTQVLGDLYPTMVVRLTFRHIQYALVADEKDWTHPEGLKLFAMLLKEMATEIEAVDHLLRAGVVAFADGSLPRSCACVYIVRIHICQPGPVCYSCVPRQARRCDCAQGSATR